MPKWKAKIGDIAEISTHSGFAYVQYTHSTPHMGQLVRVLPGIYSKRLAEFETLASSRELYFVFYPLDYALRNGESEIVSHQAVPDWAQPYPLMRWSAGQDKTGRTIAWKLFRASDPLTVETHRRTPVVLSLTREEKKLSLHELWPHPVLVRELSRGWTPERAEELRLQDIAGAKNRKASSVFENAAPEIMKHYLYFRKKSNADEAGRELRKRCFSVVVRKGADGESWLTLATKPMPESDENMEKLRTQMEILAAQYGGEYDGWEAALDFSNAASDRDGSVN